MTSRRTRTESTTARLVGTGLLTLSALLGGVAVGGWLAFQTPYWRAFKAFVEGFPVLSGLQLGLLVLFVGVGCKLALRAASTN
jgi:hypothetical protein